jgi:hypothetical protein
LLDIVGKTRPYHLAIAYYCLVSPIIVNHPQSRQPAPTNRVNRPLMFGESHEIKVDVGYWWGGGGFI